MPIFFQSVLFQSILMVVAIAIPAVFVGVCQSMKLLRQGIVADLSSIFERDAQYGDVVIPSFEFVKYKYQVASGRTYGDFKFHHWLLGAGNYPGSSGVHGTSRRAGR